jgi:hypothetical protein
VCSSDLASRTPEKSTIRTHPSRFIETSAHVLRMRQVYQFIGHMPSRFEPAIQRPQDFRCRADFVRAA